MAKIVSFSEIVGALNACVIHSSPCPRVEGGKVCHGWYLNKTITVKTTPRTVNVILTLIHEVVHHIYPGWAEAKVEEMSRIAFCELTTEQLWQLEAFLPSLIIGHRRTKNVHGRVAARRKKIGSKKRR